jgi:TetR/AcrR family transcriptional regulator
VTPDYDAHMSSSSSRRVAGPDAKNRVVLLDAAEGLMLQEGYAAVTSRRVATAAGLKPQLVHYYFRTMDDLFVAILQRRGEEALRLQEAALAGPHPLRALWAFSSDPAAVAVTMEFMGLANHRKTIRTQLAHFAEQLRAAQVKALTALGERGGLPAGMSPETAAVLMTSVSQVVVNEQALGMSTGGHEEVLGLVEALLDRLDPLDPPG